MSTLRTDNLIKRYRSRTVVNHVSVEINQGEIVGLLGPNGAGKTTTFYMTVGLVVPNEGRIILDDVDITDYPVYKRARLGIGYLAQEDSVFRKMTVEDNLRTVLEMTPQSREEQAESLERLIKEFRLEKVRRNQGNPPRVTRPVHRTPRQRHHRYHRVHESARPYAHPRPQGAL